MSIPIRVAQVVGRMKSGGVERTILNHFTHIDPTRIQFDFFAQEDSTSIPYKEIENHGGRVFLIPSYKNLPQYLLACERLFRETRPDIVHSNMNALSVFPLRAAKKANIPIRIAHSHSTADSHEHIKTLAKDILKPFSRIYPTNYAACSLHAARWLFGNKIVDEDKVFILHNAININNFTFNPEIRLKKRQELGIENSQVLIGQVGRISHQKNQLFTLQVFAQLLRIIPNAVLTIVGDSDGVDLIKEIERLGISNHIRMLGVRNDVSQLYSAFDVLMFPSTYEGLGMASIEAQAADLPVISSTEVPEEADIIPELVYRVSLQDSITNQWIPSIQKALSEHPAQYRTSRYTQVKDAGYDIVESASRLTNWYESLTKERK